MPENIDTAPPKFSRPTIYSAENKMLNAVNNGWTFGAKLKSIIGIEVIL